MIKLCRSMLVCLTVASAMSVSAIAMADSALYQPLAPTSFTGTNIAWNYNMGYMFTPHRNITVTQLGGAFYGTKTVTLYNNSTGVALRQVSVSGSGTGYTYVAITPIALTAGTNYSIGVYLNNSSGGNYYYNGGAPLLGMSNNDVTVNQACYIYGSLANPCSSTATLAYVYGVPDLKYTGGGGLGCGDITAPGRYTLTGNISATGASKCLNVHDLPTGPATTVDCEGFSIAGGPSGGQAILVQNVNNGSGVTITNCRLDTNVTAPLDIESSGNSSITKSTIGALSASTRLYGITVNSSSSISITSNTIYGMVSVASSTLTNIRQNQLNCATAVSAAEGVYVGAGSQNTVTGNIIKGNWDGVNRGHGSFGCDDGIVVGPESYDTITDNNVTKVWDVGIETIGLVRNSHFDNNIFSYITPDPGSAGAGIGGWYSMGLDTNTFNGNTVDNSARLFRFYPDASQGGGYPSGFYFQNNSFTNNTMTNQLFPASDTMTGPSVPASALGLPANQVFESNNLFSGNNWGTNDCPPSFTYYPIPSGNVTDGGNNICHPGCTENGNINPMVCNSTPTCSGWQYNAGNGLGCWYTGTVGYNCASVCFIHGGFNATTSTHTGNRAGTHFWPLDASGGNSASVECSSTDTKINWGANGATPDPSYSNPNCQLSCSCNN